ncbi:kyphoscoliosis peptidase-like [Limulus polyphemus]|uniref:Kyphoscoliosis peptidase-like n=1 Tax=Limulus polyphemus TaxID=6850 RepID=A0ABM1SE53_LIMPO|nr:kyphoscoliosis peptidase-like [Limulus polyphemus]
MGCGSSKNFRAVSPFSKALVLLHLACAGPKSDNQGAILRKKPELVDLGIQVEHMFELVDSVTQTDIPSFPGEDLEESYFEDFQGPDILDVETQTLAGTLNEKDSVKSVKVQTNLPQGKLCHSSSQTDDKITIDIGIQVVTSKVNHSTQTVRQSSSTQTSGIISSHTSGYKSDLTVRPYKSTKVDFESQMDFVPVALAANTDCSNNVQYPKDATSPFAHIERKLGESFSATRYYRSNKVNIQGSITSSPRESEDISRHDMSVVPKCTYESTNKIETAAQTDNDPITDEAPEYAACPPPCKKKEMVPNPDIFLEIDQHALRAPKSARTSVQNLVSYLTQGAKTDLQKVRAFFKWMASNMTYDWKYMDVRITAEDVLHACEGVSKDYCTLFSELCRLANIRVKTLQGFVKGHNYRPGHQFNPGEDVMHAWNAIFIFGAWRLIDTTWGTGYLDHTGKFQRKMKEYFFLTDPEDLIWSHFPYSEMEDNYSSEFMFFRWQLLDKPITLEQFNTLPKVTPFFLQYNLKIRSCVQNPVLCKVQTEVKLGAHEPVRYKFKMYPAEELENSSFNKYVFCQLKEDRLIGSFVIIPPIEGRYYLKVYAKPENDTSEDASLHAVVIFLIECVRAKKYIQPYPLNEVPWGPTQSFFNFNMKLINQSGPTIVTWGGRRKLTLELNTPMIITPQMFDANGIELDLKGVLVQEDYDNRVTFTVLPYRVGLYKLIIFGMPKPKEKGKWKLPLLASFLVDCKLTKQKRIFNT